MILSKSLLIATLYLDPFKSYKGVSRLLSHPVYSLKLFGFTKALHNALVRGDMNVGAGTF